MKSIPNHSKITAKPYNRVQNNIRAYGSHITIHLVTSAEAVRFSHAQNDFLQQSNEFKVCECKIYRKLCEKKSSENACCVSEFVQQSNASYNKRMVKQQTAQRNTARHSTAQHSTAQRRTIKRDFCSVWCLSSS